MEKDQGLTVRSGDGIVYLDLAHDDYACRYDPEEPAVAYAQSMASAGGAGLDMTRPMLASRWTDLQPCDFPRPGLAHGMSFLAALCRAAIGLRGRSVAELATRAQQLRTRSGTALMTAEQASNLFRYLLSFMPFTPKCLLSSYALLHFLAAHGLRADWVFGVQLFPFRAHCWVASGDLLLNELRHCIEDYAVIWTVAQQRP